jgi:transcriptional regulator with XRE-family HTH domain
MSFIDELLQQSEDGKREVVRAKLRVSVSEELLDRMKCLRVSKAELARRIGVSRSAITQALAGERNMSLNTLADVADALGLAPRVRFLDIAPRESVAPAFEIRSLAHQGQPTSIHVEIAPQVIEQNSSVVIRTWTMVPRAMKERIAEEAE